LRGRSKTRLAGRMHENAQILWGDIVHGLCCNLDVAAEPAVTDLKPPRGAGQKSASQRGPKGRLDVYAQQTYDFLVFLLAG
jgi:hypothetical protein